MRFGLFAGFCLIGTLCACGSDSNAAVQPIPLVDAGRAATDSAVVAPLCTAASARLRVVAGNLTSGNGQSYNSGAGGRIFKATAPDVALIQEFNVGDNSEPVVRAFVQRYFGESYTYTRGTGDIPNGVISRFPIAEQGTWVDPEISNRTHAWAKIVLPGGKVLLAVSVHLKAGSATTTRFNEAQALNANLAQTPADYTVIGGDFNTESHSERALTELGASVSVSGPYPADESGNDNTSGNRTKPYDRVLPSASLAALAVPAVLGNTTFASGAVFDTRVFSDIAAFAACGDDAVKATDSAEPNMQHMAVLRTFELRCRQ